MENLEQKRAAHALAFAQVIREGKGDGKPDAVVKKTATRILQNGILGALAFAMDKGEGPEDVFVALLYHVLKLDGLAAEVLSFERTFDDFVRQIDCAGRSGVKLPVQNQERLLPCLMEKLSGAECSAIQLQAISEEMVAELTFLRRFVRS